MSKTKALALILLMTLLLTPYAYAKTESFVLATDIVRSFDAEINVLLPKSFKNEQTNTFNKSVKSNHRATISKIKWLRRSEEPGPTRFRRLYKIIDHYMASVIEDVDALVEVLGEPGKGQFEEMSAELTILRDEFLDELKESSFSEREATDWSKPEPVIDRSPYEERPGDTRGIYNR